VAFSKSPFRVSLPSRILLRRASRCLVRRSWSSQTASAWCRRPTTGPDAAFGRSDNPGLPPARDSIAIYAACFPDSSLSTTADKACACRLGTNAACASCLPFVMRTRGFACPDVATIQMKFHHSALLSTFNAGESATRVPSGLKFSGCNPDEVKEILVSDGTLR